MEIKEDDNTNKNNIYLIPKVINCPNCNVPIPIEYIGKHFGVIKNVGEKE